MKLTPVSILLFSAALALPAVKARSAENDQRPHRPPAEAFDACSAKASGSGCAAT